MSERMSRIDFAHNTMDRRLKGYQQKMRELIEWIHRDSERAIRTLNNDFEPSGNLTKETYAASDLSSSLHQDVRELKGRIEELNEAFRMLDVLKKEQDEEKRTKELESTKKWLDDQCLKALDSTCS